MERVGAGRNMERLTAVMDPSSVYFLKFILEGYDHLFLMSTVDPALGIVTIRYAEGSRPDLCRILDSLAERIGLSSIGNLENDPHFSRFPLA